MNTRIIKWMVLGIAGLLAAMGLMFTWKCPVDCIFGVDSGVFFFKKQLLWNVIGIVACVGAALVPFADLPKVDYALDILQNGITNKGVFRVDNVEEAYAGAGKKSKNRLENSSKKIRLYAGE